MLSLGSFPEVTIAQARKKRDDARVVLATGIDPARKREQDKLAASLASSNTFGVIVAEYIDRLKAASTVSGATSLRTNG